MFEEFMRQLMESNGHNNQCNCTDCRTERGELRIEDFRELSKEEAENYAVILSKRSELRSLVFKAQALNKEISALSNLFWIKIDRKENTFSTDLKVDVNRMYLQKIIEVE